LKKFSFLLFFSFSFCIFSQDKIQEKKDSLLTYIAKLKSKELTQEKKEAYALKSINLVKDLDDSLKYEANIKIALMYFRVRKLDSFKKYSLISQRKIKATKDLQKLQKTHFYLATYYKYKVIPDSAYYHYNISKNILLELGDTITAGRRLLNVSSIQMNEKDLLGAEITAITSLRYVDKSNLNRIKSDLYNNLGLIAKKRNNYDEALKYFEKSFQYIKDLKENNKIIKSKLNYYNNSALVYQLKKDYKKSNVYIKQGLLYDSIKVKFTNNYVTLLQNLTLNNYKLHNEKNLLNNYNEILEISKKEHFIKTICTTNNLLAFYYREKKDIKKALFYANEGLTYSKKINENERTLDALKLLSELTEGNTSKNFLSAYIQLNDSMYIRERGLKNQFAKIRYETEKTALENSNLKVTNDKNKLELEKEKQQKLIGWLFAGAGLLFIGFGYLVVTNRKKKLLYDSQLKQIEAREKERQQIAKSLHDEVAGDIRILHKKLVKNNLIDESNALETVKDNVRTLSHQLSSVSFSDVTFKNQIINLVSDYFDADFIIRIKDINAVNWIDVNKSIKRTLFLSIRESIQNIDKYAEAKKVSISFFKSKKDILLTIEDDGIGFDIMKSKKGIGLKNMKERVEEINGCFTLKSEVKKGTIITIEIPSNGK
jgi:signal transduction histidine kinase